MSLSVEQSQVINMSDALRGIWRRKVLVVTTLMLGVLSGAALLTTTKPSYLSEAQVIIENLSTPFESTNNTQDGRAEKVDDRMVLSQVSVLKSSDLASRVSDALKLPERKEFNPHPSTIGTLKRIMISAGFSDDPTLFTPEQLAIKNLMSQLNVYPIPESNVIGIKYQAGEGQVAADIANAVAESYVLSTRETVAGSNGRAREWLSKQIADLRVKVSQSEAEVEKYRSEAGLLKGQTATLGAQEISELNTQITVAEAASGEASARADEIKSLLARKGSVDASSDVLGSASVQRLRDQQVAAGQKISELSATYLSNHPKMIAARQELNSIDAQIRKEALKVVESLDGQAKVAAARAASLRTSLEKMKGRESGANQSDVKLKELERDVLANRTLLETMLARFADASARQDLSLQPGFARIIQKASVAPTPYFPKPGPIMFLTTAGGLALGFGLAFLLEVMSAAARLNQSGIPAVAQPARPSASQIMPEAAWQAPQMPTAWPPARAAEVPPPKATLKEAVPDPVIVAAAPLSDDDNFPFVASMPSAISLATALTLIEGTLNGVPNNLTDAGAQIASSCLALCEQQRAKTFSFTSIGGRAVDAGLATVAATRAMANAKVKVIAIDLTADASFDTLFGLSPGPGISDLVLGEADFTKVICRDSHSSAHAMRFGSKTMAQSAASLAEKFGSILAALISIYDVVLVHAGEASPATPALVKDCHGAVLFAPQSRQKDVVVAARVLKSSGVQHILNVGLDPTSFR
jgi:uncharacterized protein involved in exopolysaccharide biosynthesis